jgi:DNA-binding NtrC family response regulator
VPSLRERREDVPQLAEQFVRAVCERFGILPRRIAPEAMEQLVAWDWSRNNVRELRNTVERMVVASDGEMIRVEHVPPELRGEPAPAEAGEPVTFEEQRRAAERRIVLAALEKHEWHITRTAEALGLADHSSLIKLMKRLGVERVRGDTGHDPA